MKLAKYLQWVLLGISAILLVVFFLLPHNTASDPMVDAYIFWAYVLVAVALVLVLAFLLIRKKDLLARRRLFWSAVAYCSSTSLTVMSRP